MITVKFYVTKYALTTGIIEVEGRKCDSDMIEYTPKGSSYRLYAHKEGRDWHRTREAAVQRAETMRRAKLASIEKQVKRLKAINFNLMPVREPE